MGLDNGIRIKEGCKCPEFAKDGNVCYWRKCWGIRDAIIEVLDPHHLNKECYFDVQAEDIDAIIKALKPFFCGEYWEENADSIWEFDDMFETLIKQVVNLEKLKEYMIKNPEVKSYFYDSY